MLFLFAFFLGIFVFLLGEFLTSPKPKQFVNFCYFFAFFLTNKMPIFMQNGFSRRRLFKIPSSRNPEEHLKDFTFNLQFFVFFFGFCLRHVF